MKKPYVKPTKPVSKIKKIKPIKPIKKKKKKSARTKDTVGTSKIEKVFMKWVIELGIPLIEQHQIAHKFYDFIIKDTKVLIEFDGDFWHCNPAVYTDGPINKMQKKAIANDRIKTTLAKVNGYELIRVWEKDFNQDKEKVKNHIFDSLDRIVAKVEKAKHV